MYDTTRSSSFVNLQKWFKMIEDNARSDIVVALVGNKSDLPNGQVDRHRAEQLAKQHNCYFIESSAKGDKNVFR